MPRELAVILCIMFTYGPFRLISLWSGEHIPPYSHSTAVTLQVEMQDSENLTELSEVFVKGLRTRVAFCFTNINIHVSSSYLGLVFYAVKYERSSITSWKSGSTPVSLFPFISPKQLPTSHMYLYIYHLSPTLGNKLVFSLVHCCISPAWKKCCVRCKLVLNECAHAWLCGIKKEQGWRREWKNSRGRRGGGEREEIQHSCFRHTPQYTETQEIGVSGVKNHLWMQESRDMVFNP